MLGAFAIDSALNKLTRKVSKKHNDDVSEHDIDIAYMPDQKHIVKDTTFFYFSQSGAESDFHKRRLALTADTVSIAMEDSDRMVDYIPLHEIDAVRFATHTADRAAEEEAKKKEAELGDLQ